MNQLPLINTQGMSSARAFARLVRERAARAGRLVKLATDKSSAISAVGQAPSKTASPTPFQDRPSLTANLSNGGSFTSGALTAAEFNLPDEDRLYILKGVSVCPHCRTAPSMDRSASRGYNLRCIWNWCQAQHKADPIDPPIYHPTSQEAIAHWNMVNALSKL